MEILGPFNFTASGDSGHKTLGKFHLPDKSLDKKNMQIDWLLEMKKKNVSFFVSLISPLLGSFSY